MTRRRPGIFAPLSQRLCAISRCSVIVRPCCFALILPCSRHDHLSAGVAGSSRAEAGTPARRYPPQDIGASVLRAMKLLFTAIAFFHGRCLRFTWFHGSGPLFAASHTCFTALQAFFTLFNCSSWCCGSFFHGPQIRATDTTPPPPTHRYPLVLRRGRMSAAGYRRARRCCPFLGYRRQETHR